MKEQQRIVHNIRFYEHVPNTIQKIAIDDLKNVLAVARSDDTIELWNCTHQPFRQKVFKCTENLECLLWCAGRLFSGHLNGTISEHLTVGGASQVEQTRSITISGGPCWSLAANPMQTVVAVGSDAGYISLYSVMDGGLHFIKLHEKISGRVLSLAWLPSGTHFVATANNCLHICSLAPAPVYSIRVTHKSKKATVMCVATLPDGTIVSGDSRGVVSFWHSEDGTLISSVMSHKAAVLALAVTKDGKFVYAAGVDPVVRLLSLVSGQWSSACRLELHTRDVRGLALDAAGKLYSGGLDSEVGVHSYPPKMIYALSDQPATGSVSTAADSALLTGEQHVEWWRLGEPWMGQKDADMCSGLLPLARDRLLLARFECSSRVVCAALSPSAMAAAYVTEAKGALTIRKLHVPQGSEQCRVSKVKVARRGAVRLLCWLTEDRLAAVTKDNRVQVWSVCDDSASLTQELAGPQQQNPDCSSPFDTDVLHLNASQCGQLLVVASAVAGVVYHLKTGSKCPLPSHSAAITAVCAHSFVPLPSAAPHSTVVVAYSDLALREYDARTGLITPFGQRVSPALQSLTDWRAVLGLSWDEAGDVLCLHDQTNMLFLSKKKVLQHDWNSSSALPQLKKHKSNVKAAKQALANGHTNSLSACNGVVSRTDSLQEKKNIIANGVELYQPKKTRVRIAKSDRVSHQTETWRQLTSTITRPKGALVHVRQLSNNRLTCVEMPFDTITSQLVQPLRSTKFGTK